MPEHPLAGRAPAAGAPSGDPWIADPWHCFSCDRAVSVVARVHCRGCGDYHDICLECGRLLPLVDDQGVTVDLSGLARSLLGRLERSRLAIFSVGSHEAHIERCVRDAGRAAARGAEAT
jgi:hypothetical protein